MNFFLSPKGMVDLNTAGSIEQNYPFSSSDLDANQIPFRNRTDEDPDKNSYEIAKRFDSDWLSTERLSQHQWTISFLCLLQN